MEKAESKQKNQEKAFSCPIKVEPMRVRRTYSGGESIDRWHEQPNQYGTSRPEEWLASVTSAVNPGFSPEPGEGLSCAYWKGKKVVLKELISRYANEMLGEEHLTKVGNTLGILAKMIDSAERLSIQVHPDKDFSWKWFHSEYGKTECWYIVDSSEVKGQKPYLLMGFRPNVTKETWKKLYEQQDIKGMIDCMHKVTPKKGEVWLIEGGFPHAIGPGCFLIELQEPTDYTMRTEKTRSDGSLLPEQLIHQGAGDEGLLECFHYDTVDETHLRKMHCILPEKKEISDAGSWTVLVGEKQTDCFSMAVAEVHTQLHFPKQNVFSIAVAVKGNGSIDTAEGTVQIKQGEQLFLPAAMREFNVVNQVQGKDFELLFCYPPKAPVLCPNSES